MKTMFYEKFETMHEKLSKISRKKYILLSVICLIVIHVLRTFGYISMEFIFHQHPNVAICDSCSMRYKNTIAHTETIPDIMHQIFFPVKSATPPDDLMAARRTWVNQHPNFTQYFWTETDVKTFIQTEYPAMVKVYESYSYWVWRVNIARYLILYHYGGWYMDLDLICTKSVSHLSQKAFKRKQSIVQHYTFPVGTSNDFIGATKNHQFLKSVLDFLPNSNRQFVFPYPNTVLRTGTTYMWGRYLNYPYQDEFMIVSEKEIASYFINQHASAWHGWDALVIRFAITHFKAMASFMTIALIGISVMLYFRSILLNALFKWFRRIAPIVNNSNNNNNNNNEKLCKH